MDDDKDTDKDIDILDARDLKVEPDFFIFLSITNAIKALKGDNLKESLVKYRMLIEIAESNARGAKRLLPEYDEKVTEFKKSDTYKNATEDGRSTLLANKKNELIIESLGSHKLRTDSLEL